MTRKRVFYIDESKAFFAVCVIICHVVLSYSPTIWWYYKSDISGAPWLLNLYELITAIAMPAFFFMFGYFFLSDYKNKGYFKFIGKRSRKYLIAIFLGLVFIIIPLSYMYHVLNRNIGYDNFFEYVVKIFFGIGGKPANWYDPYGAPFPEMKFSHLWFLEHCVIYTIIVGTIFLIFDKVFKLLYKIKNFIIKSIFSIKFLLVFSVIVVMVTYFLRSKYALDYWDGFLGFIQVEYANVAKYMSFLIIGIVFQKCNYFNKIKRNIGIWLLVCGVSVAIVCLVFKNYIPFAFASGKSGIDTFLWSLVDFCMCITITLGVILVFRDYGIHHGFIVKTLSACSFGVYIIHVPVVVIIQYLMNNWTISIYFKIILQIILGTVVSFSLVALYLSLKHKLMSNIKNAKFKDVPNLNVREE